jgi:hypothetical protein
LTKALSDSTGSDDGYRRGTGRLAVLFAVRQPDEGVSNTMTFPGPAEGSEEAALMSSQLEPFAEDESEPREVDRRPAMVVRVLRRSPSKATFDCPCQRQSRLETSIQNISRSFFGFC